jgi:adenylate kinase family enzyme
VNRLVVMGNSGSGKSRYAKRAGLPHLDLDTLAWDPGPKRRPVERSRRELEGFLALHEEWVIEGCYADLLELALPHATRLVFLNPGIEACIAHARARPWEPHKYESKEQQDAKLPMLERWIREYETRNDEFSLAAHRALFEGFGGEKVELTAG